MSTADSSLHALSALVTRDVYARFVRPDSTDSERIWVGRVTIVLTTVIALACVLIGSDPASSLAGFMEMIVGLALFAVAFSVQLLPITIDMLYLQWGRRWGATLGLAVGLGTAFCFTSLFPLLCAPLIESNTAGFGQLATLVANLKSFVSLHAAAWGLLPNLLVFAAISSIERSRHSTAD